uniref:Uncharacterized protein n=1 Tax=viral metagenome TaxID=1070528 RepID=A0A6C0BNC0_9ZZZZ
MSCSYYGLPQAYAQYPQANQMFYQPPPCDPYNNLTNQSVQQSMQLNLNSLMPQSWNNQAVAQAASSCPGNKNDWARYSVTPEGAARYVMSSGGMNYGIISRSSNARLVGMPNLLRSTPNTALQMGQQPWFNRSSLSEPLVTPGMQPWIGCG